MSADRLSDLLDLNEVPRWNSRVRLIRKQTVAEHTFNVMAIAHEIVIGLDCGHHISDKHKMMYYVLWWALVHDGPECETGDINYLFKRHFDRATINDMECALCPWYKIKTTECPSWARAIVKVADKIEEYLYITKWTAPDEAKKWIPGILDQITKHVQDANAAYGWKNLTPIVCGIINAPRVMLEREVDADRGHADPDVPRE